MKTYHDVFVEQLVRRERPGGEALFKMGVLVAGVLLVGVAFLLAKSFFPVCFAVIIILEFFAFVYTVKEFEYSFINGDVDIDLIQGKRKRKTVFSCSCKEIAAMAPCDGADGVLSGEYTRTLDASASKKAEGRWYLITERQDGTRELLIFNPNERMLEAFKGYLGRKMAYTPANTNTDKAE